MIKTNDIDDLLENGVNSEHFKRRLAECSSSYPIPGPNSVFLPPSIDICVDIGANLGCFSFLGSRVFKNIFALEPVEQNFNFINKVIIDDLSVSNIATYKLGVSNNNKNVKIYNLRGDSGDCCIYKGYTDDQQKEYEFENIEVINFQTLFKKLNIDNIGYLKIDCEGAEFEFLYDQDMSKVRYLAMEIHGSPPDCNITQFKFLQFICNNFSPVFKKKDIARNNLFFGINRKVYDVRNPEKIIEKEIDRCYQEMFAWNE